MTNSELVAAIDRTIQLLGQSHEAKPIHAELLGHLKQLLAEQQSRAADSAIAQEGK